MASTDVRSAPNEVSGSPDSSGVRVGVRRGVVRPATVDRLEWTADLRRVRAPAPGVVDERPVARSGSSTLHVATDQAGFPCLVRRTKASRLAGYVDGQRLGALLLGGVSVPGVLLAAGSEVWMDRCAWSSEPEVVDSGAVDAYVTGMLGELLGAGVLVGTGAVHLGESGGLLCEDVVVSCRIETDQRALLAAMVLAITDGDPVRLADAAAESCRFRSPRLAPTAKAVVRSLEARWTAVAFGLAVHGLGRAVLDAGVRAEPLVLFGDELLHRLDLAHQLKAGVLGLASAENVADLARAMVP